jgi:uncharacterized protein (TIGR02145 family)
MDKIETFLKYLFILSSLIFSSCGGGMIDQDGKSFKSIKIGNQEWMSENLNVSHFRNGDTIPEVRSSGEWKRMGEEGKPAWCFMQNDPEKGKKFGRLYNWYAVNDPRGLAPKGWHVASDDEWTSMINYLGGGVLAALKIRISGFTGNLNSPDENSFSGLPGGCRNSSGEFYGVDNFGYWWSANEFDTANAYLRILNFVVCDINFQNYAKIYGVSIRCMRN